MKKTIYLLRHGEIESEGSKRYIGIKDVRLSMNGIYQAEMLQHFFSSISIDKIYCSSLIRTVETAKIINEHRNVQIVKDEGLREINMGIWEGKTFDEIKAKFPDEFERRIKEIDTFKPAGGESFKECRERAVSVFKRISGESFENIIITAHAGVNRSIISDILGVPVDNIFKFKQDYGCINKITIDKSGEKIDYINYVL
ncbi:MAG: alpha-ribazole phosphatase [Bacillota bacterium]|nr:alpha-ribazole phosphatase [Bacillota bacterium]